MKRLNRPQHDPLDTYDACAAAVGDPTLRGVFVANRANIERANVAFDTASDDAAWSGLPRVPRGNRAALIAGTLSKQNLMDLYTHYMVAATGSSREVYDEILTNAGGFCPFCGGLGHAGTLDHYLPKANFPAYSVHPLNLVPCCRDCNSGKNASFGALPDQQTLHPYLDGDLFFQQRWVRAVVHRGNPVLLTFQCAPPEDWECKDKERVRHHFMGYKLSSRFSVQAGGEVAKVVQLRANSLRNLSSPSFQEYLLENANSTDFELNGWSRTAYAALAATDWFIQTDFSNPDWHRV